LAHAEGDAPFATLSAEEIRARIGSEVHLGGVFEGSAATIQPALLARGLRRLALERGIRIFEHTEMRRLTRRPLAVVADRGEVRAEAIIVATNAWASQDPGLRSALVPISSDVVATEPVPELLERIGWTSGESVSNSRLMVDYYRTTADGRIVFGRGGGAVAFRGRFERRWDADHQRASEAVGALHRLIPAARGVRITHLWGGAVDRSTDGLPFVRCDRRGAPILHVAGFSGNGVVAAPLMAKVAASCALGIDDRWSASGLAAGIPGRFPPEPLRYLAGRVVRGAVRRKEEREDEGLPVDAATLRVAAMAPSGFFKIGHDGAGEPVLASAPAGQLPDNNGYSCAQRDN
jgi:glycine/D-amino acid oxidase-like deaminating enzyme